MSRLVSPRQLEALEALASGASIGIVFNCGSNLESHASLWLKTGGSQKISVATVEALRVQGWLKDTGDPNYHWRGTTYIISAKGRAQLKKERAECK